MENFIYFIILIMFCTCFVKMLTAFSIFRYGIGLSSASVGVVFFILAIIMSLFVLDSKQLLNFSDFSQPLTFEAGFNKIKPLLEQNSDIQILEKLDNLRISLNKDAVVRNSSTWLLGFTLSELSEAFELGLIFIIPFILIDLLVTNILLALGVTQISTSLVSLPIKIMLFLSLDGWNLIVDKLLRTYVS